MPLFSGAFLIFGVVRSFLLQKIGTETDAWIISFNGYQVIISVYQFLRILAASPRISERSSLTNELARNPALTSHTVQDLNTTFCLEFNDNEFDVAVCSLSVDPSFRL